MAVDWQMTYSVIPCAREMSEHERKLKRPQTVAPLWVLPYNELRHGHENLIKLLNLNLISFS